MAKTGRRTDVAIENLSRSALVNFLLRWRTKHKGSRSEANLRRELELLSGKELYRRMSMIRDGYIQKNELEVFEREWKEFTGEGKEP